MISEFNIRQEFRAIELTPSPPMRRVRRILRLCRQARLTAAQMEGFGRMFAQAGDGTLAVRFMGAAKRLTHLNEQMRECARAWLHTPRLPLSFGHRPRTEEFLRQDRGAKKVAR